MHTAIGIDLYCIFYHEYYIYMHFTEGLPISAVESSSPEDIFQKRERFIFGLIQKTPPYIYEAIENLAEDSVRVSVEHHLAGMIKACDTPLFTEGKMVIRGHHVNSHKYMIALGEFNQLFRKPPFIKVPFGKSADGGVSFDDFVHYGMPGSDRMYRVMAVDKVDWKLKLETFEPDHFASAHEQAAYALDIHGYHPWMILRWMIRNSAHNLRFFRLNGNAEIDYIAKPDPEKCGACEIGNHCHEDLVTSVSGELVAVGEQPFLERFLNKADAIIDPRTKQTISAQLVETQDIPITIENEARFLRVPTVVRSTLAHYRTNVWKLGQDLREDEVLVI